MTPITPKCPDCGGTSFTESFRCYRTIAVTQFALSEQGVPMPVKWADFDELHYDSEVPDEDGPIVCQECLWQGEYDALIVPQG